ncbi:DUF1275 family protein [Marinibaculum pumilum]|uniref:DUF1275 family protein n=1 Tax=Marinibaculum pumilum TaxID=1766165 RepID=A0ABV7KZY7_9PROT
MTASAPAGSARALPILLAYVTAYVDVTCYLALFNTFTAFIAGSVILLGTELIHETDGGVAFNDSTVPIKLTVVLGYLAFTTLWVLLLRRLRNWRPLLVVLLGVEAVLLALFTAGGWQTAPLAGPQAFATLSLALLAVLTMSLQSAIQEMLLRGPMPTSVSAGNLTKLAGLALDAMRRRRAGQLPEGGTRSLVLPFFAALLAFVVGAISGAYGYAEFGFPAMIAPTLLLALAALLATGAATAAPAGAGQGRQT